MHYLLLAITPLPLLFLYNQITSLNEHLYTTLFVLQCVAFYAVYLTKQSNLLKLLCLSTIFFHYLLILEHDNLLLMAIYASSSILFSLILNLQYLKIKSLLYSSFPLVIVFLSLLSVFVIHRSFSLDTISLDTTIALLNLHSYPLVPSSLSLFFIVVALFSSSWLSLNLQYHSLFALNILSIPTLISLILKISSPQLFLLLQFLSHSFVVLFVILSLYISLKLLQSNNYTSLTKYVFRFLLLYIFFSLPFSKNILDIIVPPFFFALLSASTVVINPPLSSLRYHRLHNLTIYLSITASILSIQFLLLKNKLILSMYPNASTPFSEQIIVYMCLIVVAATSLLGLWKTIIRRDIITPLNKEISDYPFVCWVFIILTFLYPLTLLLNN